MGAAAPSPDMGANMDNCPTCGQPLDGGGAGAAGPSGDPEQDLQTAIDSLTAYMQSDETDPAETHVVAKALTALHGLQASDQKQNEAAAGVTPVHKGMAKAIKGIQSQVYGP